MLRHVSMDLLKNIAGGKPDTTVDVSGGGGPNGAGGIVKINHEVVPGTTVSIYTGGNTELGVTSGGISINKNWG